VVAAWGLEVSPTWVLGKARAAAPTFRKAMRPFAQSRRWRLPEGSALTPKSKVPVDGLGNPLTGTAEAAPAVVIRMILPLPASRAQRLWT
jgi:hypothetical protein